MIKGIRKEFIKTKKERLDDTRKYQKATDAKSEENAIKEAGLTKKVLEYTRFDVDCGHLGRIPYRRFSKAYYEFMGNNKYKAIVGVSYCTKGAQEKVLIKR